MKTTISYADRETPNFDAVADIQNYLGDRYETVAEVVKPLPWEQFQIACSFAGIEGFPVTAWFRHFNGEEAV